MPRQPDPLPPVEELAQYSVERMILLKRPRAVFRRRGITIIIVQLEDRWWSVEKMHKGQVIGSKIQKRLPPPYYELVTGRKPRWQS